MNLTDGTGVAMGDIFIFNRERAELTGICDVSAFTDDSITVSCSGANISIEGNSMRIDSFDSATGNLTVRGRIDGVFYYGGKDNGKKERKGKLTKLFGQ